MHATMLQLMGINPHQLIFNHHGLQESPLGVTGGRVIHEVFG